MGKQQRTRKYLMEQLEQARRRIVEREKTLRGSEEQCALLADNMTGTGYSEAITPEESKDNGFTDFIMKPMVKNRIAEAIRRAPDRKE